MIHGKTRDICLDVFKENDPSAFAFVQNTRAKSISELIFADGDILGSRTVLLCVEMLHAGSSEQERDRN